jgi:hypothetical protein
VLHHVEAQFLGLAGEHFGELQEVEEEHELQVFAGQLLAFLGDGLAAGGGFAGGVDRGSVVFQIRGLRDGGRGQGGGVRGGGVEEGEQVRLHLVVTAGVEDVAALWQRLQQHGRVRAKSSDEAGLDAFHVGGDLQTKIVLGLFAGLAQAEAALVIGHAVLDGGEGTGGRGDVGGEFATGVVRAQALQVVGGESDEFGHADAIVIERVFQ